MYIRYVRSSLAVVSCGGGLEEKYLSDIHLYTCKCLHFKSNIGKRFEVQCMHVYAYVCVCTSAARPISARLPSNKHHQQ